jgi:hypothetical protein
MVDVDSPTLRVAHRETSWKTTSRFRRSSMVFPPPLRPRQPTVTLTSLTGNCSTTSELTGVRAMIETYPLEKAAEAFARMMSGNAQFRVVLTM